MYTYNSITKLARELRKKQTKAESILWEELRNRKLDGYKFSRQFPVVYLNIQKHLYFFIADFYCHDEKIVIELDGKIHDFQKDYDKQRDIIMKGKGLRVLRLKNKEIEDVNTIKKKVCDFIKQNQRC